jgi:predicted esterase
VETRKLEVSRTARFHTQGDPNAARVVWFVLHGYGQLAADFLAQCDALSTPSTLVVAPEGLSRFYLRDGSGPIGASWMTSDARADEINDYVAALDRIASSLADLGVADDADRNLLGFSQGAATALRWAAFGTQRFDRLVLWGGGVAKDVEVELLRSRLSNTSVDLVRGEKDQFLDAEGFALSIERLNTAGLHVRSHSFAGGHRLDRELLSVLAR